MIAAISKFFNWLSSLSNNQKKDLKKIEFKTIRSLNNILCFVEKLSRCSKWKPVFFGLPSFFIDKKIPYKKEVYYLSDEKLKCKILISEYEEGKSNNDFIIFLHGSALDHTQWLDKKGFGSQYRDVFIKNTKKLLPVASVSFGMSYIIKNGLPFPYNADLENIFIDKIIPYLRDKLKRYGKIHLIGHSIGAFSALNLTFKYPTLFKSVFAISPFIVKDNPFSKNFKYYKNALSTNPGWSYMVKYNLLYAFKDKSDWKKNNPADLILKINKKNRPLIIITQSNEELLGFSENINWFRKKLEENNIPFLYHRVAGDHHNSDIKKGYFTFFKNL